MDSAIKLVHLMCIHDGKKLRMRVTSEGYFPFANCMCPREIRIEGRCYTIPSNEIILKQGSRGTYFYVLSNNIKHIEVLPKDVFHDKNNSECVICLNSEKTVVFAPCGHFCSCEQCYAKLKKTCPLCRSHIDDAIHKSKFVGL